MGARALGIFFAGFAAGIVFLAILLWQTHSLATVEPARAGPPVANPPITKVPAGPQQPGLSMPVEGIHAGDLRDSFQETRNGHLHEALDILAQRGTPVLAVAEGNIAKLFLSKAGGLTVYQFDDSQNWCFYYAHLDRYARGLQEGALVRKSDVLGYVGTSGDAPTGTPHLHLAIFKLGPEKRWWKGIAVNPYPYLTGQATWPP